MDIVQLLSPESFHSELSRSPQSGDRSYLPMELQPLPGDVRALADANRMLVIEAVEKEQGEDLVV